MGKLRVDLLGLEAIIRREVDPCCCEGCLSKILIFLRDENLLNVKETT